MKKLGYFLIIGLAFTAFQVATVGAQTGDPNMQPPTMGTAAPMGTATQVDISHCAAMDSTARPACEEAAHRASAPNPGMQPPLDCPPGSGNPLCAGAPNMPPGAPGMPPMTPPPGAPGIPPTGDHSGMSSLGAHCGAIQAKNEKKRMRKEVKCLRRALHEHKPTVKLRQTKDGLGAYGCGVRKTGSKPAQIACLRGMLDAPSGTPGMAPMGDHSGMPPMGVPAVTGKRSGGKMGN